MKILKLKTCNGYFAEIWAGTKTFEIRKNDRDFKVDDRVVLEEIQITQAPPSPYGVVEYTGRAVFVEITYITNFEQKPGYVVFSFKELSRSPSTI